MKTLVYDPALVTDPAAEAARLECSELRADAEVGNAAGYAVEWTVPGRVLLVPGPITRPALRALAPAARAIAAPAPSADELALADYLAAPDPTPEQARAAIAALIRRPR